jgi:hypothetical protein
MGSHPAEQQIELAAPGAATVLPAGHAAIASLALPWPLAPLAHLGAAPWLQAAASGAALLALGPVPPWSLQGHVEEGKGCLQAVVVATDEPGGGLAAPAAAGSLRGAGSPLWRPGLVGRRLLVLSDPRCQLSLRCAAAAAPPRGPSAKRRRLAGAVARRRCHGPASRQGHKTVPLAHARRVAWDVPAWLADSLRERLLAVLPLCTALSLASATRPPRHGTGPSLALWAGVAVLAAAGSLHPQRAEQATGLRPGSELSVAEAVAALALARCMQALMLALSDGAAVLGSSLASRLHCRQPPAAAVLYAAVALALAATALVHPALPLALAFAFLAYCRLAAGGHGGGELGGSVAPRQRPGGQGEAQQAAAPHRAPGSGSSSRGSQRSTGNGAPPDAGLRLSRAAGRTAQWPGVGGVGTTGGWPLVHFVLLPLPLAWLGYWVAGGAAMRPATLVDALWVLPLAAHAIGSAPLRVRSCVAHAALPTVRGRASREWGAGLTALRHRAAGRQQPAPAPRLDGRPSSRRRPGDLRRPGGALGPPARGRMGVRPCRGRRLCRQAGHGACCHGLVGTQLASSRAYVGMRLTGGSA